MRKNGYIGASDSKIWPCHSLRQPRFPIRRVYFHYRMTVAAYIWCFCAQFSLDPVTLTFHLLTLHIPIFSILRLSVPELWVTQSDHITITCNGHCACVVSRDLSPGCKNNPHFWNPWPQIAYSLCHYQGATTKINSCNRRKIVFFPLWRLQCSLHMRSITWPVHSGSPKTTRNNFLTPNYLFTIQLLWDYDDDKG